MTDALALDASAIPPHLQASAAPKILPRIMVPTVIAASFVLGMIVTTALQPTPDWIDQVASYRALYATQALPSAPQNADVTAAVLAQVEQVLGAGIRTVPTIEGMAFSRVQVLAIEREPLIQFAYLRQEGTPFAQCITRVSDVDRAVNSTTTHNLAAASWVEGRLGFVLIGGAQPAQVTRLEQGLAGVI